MHDNSGVCHRAQVPDKRTEATTSRSLDLNESRKIKKLKAERNIECQLKQNPFPTAKTLSYVLIKDQP